MESAFNLFRMPPVWKSFYCAVYPGGDPNKWVYVAITTVPMGWVGAVDFIQHIARRLVFNIAGVTRASEVSSAGSFPSHPPYSLVCMDGLDVVCSSNAPANGTLRLFLTFVLHVLASSFCSTLGNGWSGRPLHPFSAQSLPRGTKGQSLVSLWCVSLSVVHVSFATQCGPVHFRSWRLPSSVLCLSGRTQQTGTEKAWIHRGRAMQRFSWRLSALGGGIASLLVHSGFDPRVFFFISFPHVSHASVGRLGLGR